MAEVPVLQEQQTGRLLFSDSLLICINLQTLVPEGFFLTQFLTNTWGLVLLDESGPEGSGGCISAV